MAKFILRRLLWVIPVMLGVVLIVFTIDRVGPGDPSPRRWVEPIPRSSMTQRKRSWGWTDHFWSNSSPIYRESSPGEIWVTPSRPVCR